MISYFLSNTSAKNYRNRIVYVVYIVQVAGETFFETRCTFFFIGPSIGRSVGWLSGVGPKFLDNGSKTSPNGLPRNLHTSLVCVPGNVPANFFYLTPKNFRGENLKFR